MNAISLLKISSRLKKLRKRSTEQNRATRNEGQGASNQRNLPEESSADGFSDLDELANLEEQLEIEQFLAEIRSSEVQSSTISLSTQARKEFIANILISQRVSMVQDESKDDSEENDKESDLFICRSISGEDTKESGDSMAAGRPQCAICLLDYADGDAICWSHNKRCNHHFHKGCMVEWLKSNDECPLCRNNYLALSDDDRTEVDGNSSLPDDPSVFSQGTYGLPSIIHSDSSFESEPPYRIDLDPVVFRAPNMEDCIRQDNVSAVTSSDGSIYTENDSWSHSDEVEEEGAGSIIGNSDAWSCPSVNDVEDLPSTDNFAIEHRPRNRQSTEESTAQIVQRGTNQEVSLELDDLIVDGLMLQLEKRPSSREVPIGIDLESESCTSVYTRSSDGNFG
ncbi:unnamed protein product [Cylindrotheca closterium]|uniref:RING-type E3 ubiquitin transferase n=1 Tax=Cylindrotheca closterium TaxID=2856 RepID=A0AAD2CQ91_9STRA|nr:unnamed protein product [Cylindrotheca closterium]